MCVVCCYVMFVVWCWLIVVCCLSCDVCGLLFVARCSLLRVHDLLFFVFVVVLLFVVQCVFIVVCCV